MRKALVISTPIIGILGIVLQVFSDSIPGSNSLSIGNTVFSYTAILSILVLLFTVAAMIVTRKENASGASVFKTSGIILFIAALALGLDAFQNVLLTLTSGDGISFFPFAVSIFEFISAIVIVVFSCKIFLNFELKHDKSLLLAIIPVIWLLIKLAYEFLGYTRVADISAHYYHVLMTSTTLMYLLYYFKSASNGFTSSVYPVVCLTLPLCFFSLVTVIPTFVNAISLSESVFDAISGFDIFCLLIGVFAFITSINLVSSKNTAKK